MKRKFIFLLIGIIGVFIIIFQYQNNIQQGKVDKVVLEYGNSKKFSREEIQAAMDCVLKEFKSFKGCTLQRLYYDESMSNNEFGSDNINGIVLLSDFCADVSYSGSVYEPGEENTEYSWILVRDSKFSKWVLKSCGYA